MSKMKRFLNGRFPFVVFVMALLVGCGESAKLAPVSKVQWQPVSVSSYKVRAGDTLYSIAFRYDMDYRSLAETNHLSKPWRLYVGQRLALNHKLYKSPRTVKSQKRSRHVTKRRVTKRVSSGYRINKAWRWPLNGVVNQRFAPNKGKKGINIISHRGAKVKASQSGVVAYAGNGLPGYGNLIIIKHNSQYLTAYGNNARLKVREGQHVKAGQVIATVGHLNKTNWGLHFEVRKRGKPVNPMIFLKKG